MTTWLDTIRSWFSPDVAPATQQPDPRETALDDPKEQTDWASHKQTDAPWLGNPEKEQRSPKTEIDLEEWKRSNTH